MILVDSSVWIDFFNGTSTRESDCLDEFLGIIPFAVGDIILAEVLQGFRRDRDLNVARGLLLNLPIFNLVDTQIALKSVEYLRALRKKGMTVRRTVDGFIATFCIENEIPLLTSDRDFKPFQRHFGLKNALSHLYR